MPSDVEVDCKCERVEVDGRTFGDPSSGHAELPNARWIVLSRVRDGVGGSFQLFFFKITLTFQYKLLAKLIVDS
jgi:hypothetical protein